MLGVSGLSFATTIVFAAAVLQLSGADRPTVGAIRWDAWYGGPYAEACRKTFTPKYHYRLPFFADVAKDGTVTIDGAKPGAMEREIDYAVRAGIDYWAFCAYTSDMGLDRGLDVYLKATGSERLKFALILLDWDDKWGIRPEKWPKTRDRWVALLKDSRFMRIDGRPLVFIYPPFGEERVKDFKETARRSGCNPYYVNLTYASDPLKMKDALQDADSVGCYCFTGGELQSWVYRSVTDRCETKQWEAARKLGLQIVLTAMSGFDPSPRRDTDVWWQKGQFLGMRFHAPAKPEEISATMARALRFVRDNPETCPANTILWYAWNEFDEGGWLCPTRKADGTADESRVEALRRVLRGPEPIVRTPGREWIPCQTAERIAPGSALDFSSVSGVDAPAGKYGPVKVRGGCFEFRDRAGRPQRFYGANVCFEACFLPWDEACKLADTLVRTGYNAVRFHHFDRLIVEGDPKGVTLNPEKQALFEGVVAACIERGLYVTTDLFVGRTPLAREVGLDRGGFVSCQDEYKNQVLVSEKARANFKTFVRGLLGHVNARTGRRLADEPALVGLAIVNEGNPGVTDTRYMIGERHWEKSWSDWLSARRKVDDAYRTVQPVIPKDIRRRKDLQGEAFNRFLSDVERRFYADMRDFLRKEIGCNVPLTDMSSGHNPLVYQLVRDELFDYVDAHTYWGFPDPAETGIAGPTIRFPVRNVIRGMRAGVPALAACRLWGKPFTVTEFNYAGPDRFRSVGALAMAATAARQGWSGLWRFTWASDGNIARHPSQCALDKGNTGNICLDIALDPIMSVSERVAIALFLRGDLTELPEKATLLLPPQRLEPLHVAKKGSPSMDRNRICWSRRFGMRVSNESAPEDGVTWKYPQAYDMDFAQAQSDVGAPPDACVVAEEKSGVFCVATERTCGIFHPNGGKSRAGCLTVDLGGVPSTVFAVSVDGKPLPSSRRILVAHLTDVQDSGTVWLDREETQLGMHGRLPHLMRTARAEIDLAVGPGIRRVWALNPDGSRRSVVQSCRTAKGHLVFLADVGMDKSNATCAYEVECP